MKTTAAKLIEQIRSASGLSQAELARRTGTTRSVINAYQRGSRRPSLDAMARLAAAGGYDLVLEPRESPVDLQRANRILQQVVDFAELFPYEPSSEPDVAPLPPVRGAA